VSSLGKTILSKLLVHDVTLKKITETTEDTIWGTTSETVTEYTIKAYIAPVTLEDLRWLPSGPYSSGDARGYFYTQYTSGGTTIEVKPDDIIVYNGVEYVVDSISDYEWNFKFRSAYLRRIVPSG